MYVSMIYYYCSAFNPCSVDNGNCSHMCLLSAVTPSRFSCACPNDYVLTENQTHCQRKKPDNPGKMRHVIIILNFTYLAPPRLLFSLYSTLVRRVNTDGQNLMNLYSATYPRALDFDFQWAIIFLIPIIILLYNSYFCFLSLKARVCVLGGF